MMNKIAVPESYNYIGVFLTFACNLRCDYCINRQYGAVQKYKQMTPQEWIDGLNRIQTRPDLPITLQGGEPTMYKGIYEVIAGVDRRIHIDILTNGQFNVEEFICKVDPLRLQRSAKYASIRLSYHPWDMPLEGLINTAKRLQDASFSVGVWVVDHPGCHSLVRASQELMLNEGIDCRLKEFLGEYRGKFYGTYKYPDAVDQKECRTRRCKPSEMLIAPDGSVHQCHNSLYTSSKGYAHILNPEVSLIQDHIPCSRYGQCNSCDVKLKTNRFQEDGHCSVDVL